MGLFGNSAEKDTKAAAAQAESDRLKALPVDELAAEVMLFFGPAGVSQKTGHRQGPVDVAKWLLADYSTKTKYTQPVLGPSIEALGALENAGLVERMSRGNSGASAYRATRAGDEAITNGSIGRHLK